MSIRVDRQANTQLPREYLAIQIIDTDVIFEACLTGDALGVTQ